MKTTYFCKFKSVITSLILILMLTAGTIAQTPQFYNYNTGGAGNAFPFSVLAGKQVQLLFLSGDFNSPTPAPSGNITHLYIRFFATGGSSTFSNLTFKMGLTTLTDLPVGVWYTGQLDTVYFRPSVQLQSTAGNFIDFTLDRPFTYDNTKSIILDISQCGVSDNIGMLIANTVLSGNRRNTSLVNTSCPFPFGNQGAFVLHCGFDINPVAIEDPNTSVPKTYSLEQNYPNPFNPSTVISFYLPKSGNVKLTVYDILGHEVKSLYDGFKQAGSYSIQFNADDFPSGVYFYKLESGSFTNSKKMLLIK